jgi:hypothetical protein
LANLTTTVSVVKPSWSYGLFVEVLAGALTSVSIFTGTYPRHSIILIGAIGVQGVWTIIEIIFFINVSKAVSGSQAKATLGLGSSTPLPLTLNIIWD